MRQQAILLSLLFLVACGEQAKVGEPALIDLPDIDQSWNYGAPEETRAVFLGLLADHVDTAPHEWVLELKTQIARTHSLKGEFDEAHGILDGVEKGLGDSLETGGDRARIRYLLERGRAFNSAGDKERAKVLFVEAFEVSEAAGEEFYTIDAAHMVAIAAADADEANQWNLRGLEHARRASDERARGWAGPLTNNMGWTAFESGKLDEALTLFEENRNHFEAAEKPDRARIARWSIARVKREQGAIDEALAMQLELLAENEAAGSPDGYGSEELGELYLLKEDTAEAAKHFARAHELLSQDDWLVRNEPERLERLKELSER